MDITILEELGLTKSEIQVYLALLELGSSSTGKIVENSKTASSKVYEILDKLIQKGLVSFIVQRGIKQFEAASPQRILDYANEREEQFALQKKELRHLIPELELKQKLSQYRSQATIFKGFKGIKSAYEDILNSLKKNEEYYVMGATTPTEPYFSFIKHFHQRRASQGIKVKILYSKRMQPLADAIKDTPLTQIRFTSQELLSSAFILMYAQKTLIIVSTKHDLTLFQIESQEVTDSLKAYFEILWNQDVTVGTGFETFEREWQDLFDQLSPGESYDVLGAGYGPKETEKDFARYFSRLHQERIKRGIKGRLLFQPGAEKSIEKYKLQEFYQNGLEYKNTPIEYKFPVQIFAAKDRSILLVQKKDPVTIVIKNREIATSFLQYFNHLWNQKVVAFEGKAGVRAVFDDMLHYKEVWFIGGNDGIKKYFPNYWEEHNKERIKRKVVWHDLIDAQLMSNLFPGQERSKISFYEYKILPPELSSPHVIAFYGDKVANIIWREKTIVTVIEDKEIREGYKKYFDYLWKTIK